MRTESGKRPLPAHLAAGLPGVGRLQWATLQREALLHGALLLVVVLATLAGYANALPVEVHADDNLQQTFRGLYQTEQGNLPVPFRWTDGSGSVCVMQFGHAPRSAVRLTLLGNYAVPLGIDTVTLGIDGHPLVTTALPPTKRHYHLLVAGRQQQGGDLCVTMQSETVQPAAEPRQLGVQFHALQASRLTRAGMAAPAFSQVALNIAAALVGFWLLRSLGLRALWAAALLALLALLLGTAIASGLVAPGLEASRSLLLLVGGGALLLVGSLGLRWLDRAWPTPPAWMQHRLSRDLAAMALWSLVLWGAISAVQQMHGRHGVWPLKAGVWPGFTPLVLLAVVAFVPWLALVLRRLRAETFALLPGALLLLAGAVALPVLIKTSVRGPDSLYTTFRDNPSDYIHDVPLIGADPLGFLGRYVELSPTLAWHNSNHPPGSVLLLWLVENVFGAGTMPASWVAIVLSGAMVLAAFWLGLRLGGRHVALLAGALVAVMPGHTVYSATSMDGVFNMLNAFAAVAFFLALEPGARRWRAVLAGVLIALALFFSYVTTQLFFFGAAVCVLALVRGQTLPFVLRQGALVVAVLVGLYALLYLGTGFNIVEASMQAKANNARLLADPTDPTPELLGLPSVAHYLYYLSVNIAPFLWYLAPWGLAALVPVVVAGARHWKAPRSLDVLALSVVALVLGMWLSGLFVREVERIWGFVYPLAAVLMVRHIWQGDTRRERLWRAGLWLSLFFAQSAVIRMLLNTYW